jgi:hypothetical protein
MFEKKRSGNALFTSITSKCIRKDSITSSSLGNSLLHYPPVEYIDVLDVKYMHVLDVEYIDITNVSYIVYLTPVTRILDASYMVFAHFAVTNAFKEARLWVFRQVTQRVAGLRLALLNCFPQVQVCSICGFFVGFGMGWVLEAPHGAISPL